MGEPALRLEPTSLLDAIEVLAEAVPDALVVVDSSGEIAFANGKAERLLGWESGELVGESIEVLIPAHLRARHVRHRERFSDAPSLRPMGPDLLLSAVTKTGEEVPVEVGLVPIMDGDGGYTLASIRDARDRLDRETKLALAEERYKRLVEEIPLVTYVQRPDCTFDYVSPQAEALLGFSPESWLGDPEFLENVVHPADRERVRAERAWSPDAPLSWRGEYRLVGRDGEIVWVEDRSLVEIGQDGHPLSRRGFLIDVTEHRRVERARTVSEQPLALVFDGVSDLLLLVRVDPGPTFRWLAANDAFRTFTGLSNVELAGKTVHEILDAEAAKAVSLRYEETIAAAAPRTFREEIRTGDGRVVAVETRLTPVFDEAGNCTHLLGASRDLSERESLEARLREAQKLQAVGRLAGGVAHDFNNLLTVISFAAEELRREFGETPSEDVTHILEAADRAAALTRQLLAFSRRQVLRPAELNLNEVVTEMETMLNRLIGEDVALLAQLHDRAVGVSADRAQLEQIIVNLVVNARDAMPDGGTITIGTSIVDLSPAEARARDVPRGRYACLTVTDTGVGMDDEVKGKLFEPFFTTKERFGGSGLGLATVYGIVRQSIGAIDVDSAPAQGTTFSVYLPWTGISAGTDSGGEKPGTAPGAETILLVEDEDLVRALAERSLVAAGYRVLAASTGPQALELAGKYDGRIDAVVTDVIMPGMNGREFAGRLQTLRPGVPTLYVSGYTADVIAQRGVIADGTWFLEKPFTSGSLTRKLRELLAAGPP